MIEMLGSINGNSILPVEKLLMAMCNILAVGTSQNPTELALELSIVRK
jgi:hypothetical protein